MSFLIASLTEVWSWMWLPALGLAASLVGIGTGLLRSGVARLLYRGARLARPTCRRCGSHVRGEGDRIPERCPECGNDTTRDHAITIVGLQRAGIQRGAALFLSAGVTVVGLIVAGMLLVGVQESLPEKVPQWQMAGEEKEWQRLWRRFHLDQDRFVAESDVIRAEFRQWIQEEREAEASDPGRERPLGFLALAAELVRRGVVSEEDVARELAPLLPHPTFAMTPRATPGSRVWIHASFPGASGCRAAFTLGEVRIAPDPAHLPPGLPVDTSADAYANGNATAAAWFFDAPLDPGTYEVTFEIRAMWEPHPEVRFAPLGPEGGEDVGTSSGAHRVTRTLRVLDGAEELVRVDDPARSPFARFAGGRSFSIRSTERFGGRRDAVHLWLPMGDLRLAGEWTLELADRAIPLQVNDEMTPWTQGSASRIADRPPGGWPDRLSVRYTPTDAIVVATTTSADRTLKPEPKGRHHEGLWAVPTTLTFRRVPSADPNDFVYEVDSVEDARSR